METRMAKKLGLYKPDSDGGSGNGFRAYDTTAAGENRAEDGKTRKRQAPAPPKGHRPDPRASRLVSYNDVDGIDDEDDLVYER